MSVSLESPLEWLLSQSGGKYLSDLRPQARTHVMSRVLRAAIERAPRGRWTGAQWSEAAAYLLGSSRRLDDEAHAIEHLRANI